MIATPSTPPVAPAVAATRLRSVNTGSARGGAIGRRRRRRAHLAARDIDLLTVNPVHDRPRTLPWALVHTTNETVWHSGHADILRELIDGVTGR